MFQPANLNLPTGLARLENLRAAGQVYVDKTHHLAELLATGERYLLLSRPRRFGKTLLLSTLEHIFGKRNDLLTGTAIHTHAVWDRIPRCPVIKLDLLRVRGGHAEVLRQSLRDVVDEQYLVHGLAPPPAATTPETALSRCILQLRQRHAQNVAVLIDEYDAPITNRFGLDHVPPVEELATTMHQMREFFSVLKSSEEHLGFVFLTGITRLQNAGLFSALNNLWDISSDADFATICGFTEEEVGRYLTRHVELGARHYGCTPDRLRKLLRDHYNGYRFTVSSAPVYNPLSCLHALKLLSTPRRAAEVRQRGFPRPWLKVGIPLFLFRHMQDHRYDVADLVGPPGDLDSTFNLGHPNVRSLLFQTGFLTLRTDAGHRPQLDYPNREVETGFKAQVLQLFSGRDDSQTEIFLDNQERMRTALVEGRYPDAAGYFPWLLEAFTYEQLRDESHYKLLLHTACLFLPGLQPHSEVRTLRGIADTVLETADALLVFEFKLNRTLAAARKQLTARAYGDRFQALGKRVIGIAVNLRTPRDIGGQRDKALESWEVESWLLHSAGTSASRAGINGNAEP